MEGGKNQKRRGPFISIEGGEGVGKSGLIERLQKILADRNIKYLVTREPGGTPQADRIRRLFAYHDPTDPWLAESEALLIAAARAQHVKRKILPALKAGTWVLCDRFTDSTRVYQAAIGEKTLESLIHVATSGLEPDITLLIDCPAAIALERISHRSGGIGLDSPEKDTAELNRNSREGTHGTEKLLPRSNAITRFDEQDLAAHTKRRMDYLALAARFPHRITVLNGTAPSDIVAHEAWNILKSLFAS
jgi:dTMP kinase